MTGAQDAPDVVRWVAAIASGDRAAEAAVVEHFAPRLRAMLRALRVDRAGTRVTVAFRMPTGVLVEELRGAASDDGR